MINENSALPFHSTPATALRAVIAVKTARRFELPALKHFGVRGELSSIIGALLLTAIAPLSAAAEESRAAETTLTGQQAFAACSSCHSRTAEAAHKVGPNLHGIVGSKAASADGYNYSPALSSSGVIWTRETLFAWIAGSEAFVPGSWMLYHNTLSGEEVMRLIDFLETANP